MLQRALPPDPEPASSPPAAPVGPLQPALVQAILADALRLGAQRVRLLVGRQVVADLPAGPRPVRPAPLRPGRSGAGAPRPREAVRRAGAPITVRGAPVGRLAVAGPARSAADLAAIAAVTAARLAEAWELSAEIESLAREVVHNYEELHLLYELGNTLTGRLSPQDAADAILEMVLRTIPADHAELRLGNDAAPLAAQPSPNGAPDGLVASGARLAVPLRSGGQLVGSLTLLRGPGAEPFTSVDRKLLDAVGTLAGNALHNARLYDALRRQAETLREQQARLRAVLDSVGEGILAVDASGAIAACNPAAERLFGSTAPELIGQRLSALLPESDVERIETYLRAGAAGHEARRHEGVGRRRNGSTFPLEFTISAMELNGEQHLVVAVRDITERKRWEEALEHQTLHDALTGLPNRVLLRDRLDQAILAAQRDGRPLALLLMDLDRFKEINDTLGHRWGDLLLQEVARRLRAALRESDTVARLGGDEFAVVLPGTNGDGAMLAATRLVRAFDEPFALDERQIVVSASVGAALCPEHGADAETLLRRADIAMYVAKRAHSGYALYAPEQDRHSSSRLALVSELRAAIARDELLLCYQPKADLETGRIVGVEALVRWRHPQRGLIPPDQFIPLAEQTGLIGALSRWVLAAALRQCRAWQDEGFRLPVAVNLSPQNLLDPALPETIARLLAESGVAAGSLKIEITETTLMADPDRALDVLRRLHALGVQIAIDDFGTGYSSLAYLKRLPVAELKIDRSFVQQMAVDENDRAIVRSTIGLGHDLGLGVVAEGVEDRTTWELLAHFGCDTAQGYYLSRPLTGPDLTRWLKAWSEQGNR